MENIKNIFLYQPDSPLYFTRLYFWAFFLIVLLFYSFLYKKNTARNTYLFIISLFFYYKSGGYFFFLLIISTIVDYTIGLLIYGSNNNFKRKFYLIISIVVNLGLLSYYKYAYFYIEIINTLFNTHIQAVDLLAQLSNNITGSHFNISDIILPVGISFFTFQTISYSVDVYRHKTMPLRNIIDYGFYVSFFPQLVAGPIVRASEFVPQLMSKYKLSKEEFGQALFLIMQGLIKKIMISDYISINFVDRVFESPLSFSGFENLMGLYGYSLQIYCDFSGYTDIAIGIALLLGFRLPLNFNSPYKARSLTDFWHRWHISLSTWLRDYLYFPLGGNRKSKIRTNINLLITMLLGGLWHGASLKFILWGGIHGVGLIIQKFINSIFPSKKSENKFSRLLGIILTFHLVTFAWLFFRADNMETVSYMLTQIFTRFEFSIIPEFISGYYTFFFLLVTGFIIHWLPSTLKENYRGWFIQQHTMIKIVIIVIVVIAIYNFKISDLQPFIYFQF